MATDARARRRPWAQSRVSNLLETRRKLALAPDFDRAAELRIRTEWTLKKAPREQIYVSSPGGVASRIFKGTASQRHATIVSEKAALLHDTAGDVNGAPKHLLDLQLLQNTLEMAPRAREALERARRSQRGVPHEQIQRHRTDRRPLESGR